MKNFEESIVAVKPGRYVVGVSGGVDSVVLLEVLRKRPELELIVAHFDHGIRKNSQQDRKFVQNLAVSHNLKFDFSEGHLKQRTSEATARNKRYMFLRHTCNKYNAAGIILAHHQDDLLETAIINLLRGTGRRGLNALQNHPTIIRPMLGVTKADIINYAKGRNLQWREDPTNLDLAYLRNYVRHNILTKTDQHGKEKLLQVIVRQKKLNRQIDSEIHRWLTQHTAVQEQRATLPRYSLIMMPQTVAYEILQVVCKTITGKTTERQLMELVLLFVKTAASHKLFILGKHWQLRTVQHEVIVEPRQPVVS